MTNLAEQKAGERHARRRRTRLKPATQRIRHIANWIVPVICAEDQDVCSTCQLLEPRGDKTNKDSEPWHGPETRIKVTQVTFTALNHFYPRSIQALSGVNSEDQDDDQVSQTYQFKGDCP
jgi:hypothetical protein